MSEPVSPLSSFSKIPSDSTSIPTVGQQSVTQSAGKILGVMLSVLHILSFGSQTTLFGYKREEKEQGKIYWIKSQVFDRNSGGNQVAQRGKAMELLEIKNQDLADVSEGGDLDVFAIKRDAELEKMASKFISIDSNLASAILSRKGSLVSSNEIAYALIGVLRKRAIHESLLDKLNEVISQIENLKKESSQNHQEQVFYEEIGRRLSNFREILLKSLIPKLRRHVEQSFTDKWEGVRNILLVLINSDRPLAQVKFLIKFLNDLKSQEMTPAECIPPLDAEIKHQKQHPNGRSPEEYDQLIASVVVKTRQNRDLAL